MMTAVMRDIFLKLFYYFLLGDRNLVSNETNFDQEKESDKSNSLQDQEPYSKIIKIDKSVTHEIL